MCRMVGYLGPALALRELVSQGPHSLVVQSYRPRKMTSGTVNADGFGAALWLDDSVPEPALYRTGAPIWADPNLGWMGDRLRVRAALAAVRSATPGIGYELPNVQPFVRGRIAFVHNGFIEGFRHGPQRRIRERLGKAAYESIAGSSDSEHLFALVLDALDKGAGSLGEALRRGLRALGEVCESERRKAVATVVLSDGAELVGCRWAHGALPATLSLARFPVAGEGASALGVRSVGFCVASEPIDVAHGEPRERWRELEAASLFSVGPALRQEPLPEPVLEPLE